LDPSSGKHLQRFRKFRKKLVRESASRPRLTLVTKLAKTKLVVEISEKSQAGGFHSLA
jgi:hypothetical protein